ncbi:MAG: hypothetical protein AAGM21_16640 [Pseudomonadota bacterium]
MKKTLILVTGSLMAATMASTLAVAATMEEADSNADGMITFDELLVVAPDVSEETFRLADANGDGMIDVEEFGMAQETGLLPAG